ncbi:MAG: pyridoxamine 5'-phosphate oxidase family protein, partial [Anaerolineales bacterium]
MDADSSAKLAALIRAAKTAALGTLREGGPFVSMVLFAVEGDFSAFYIHASRLAFHTQDMLADPRVSLMIAETETPGADPQQLARISIRGEAALIAKDSPEYARVRDMYLAKYPSNAPLFGF